MRKPLQVFIKSLKTTERREAFAAAVGVTLGHLRNVGYGIRSCDPAIATAIELFDPEAPNRQMLFPDDWRAIWPELIGSEGAPAASEAATTGEVAHG